MTSYYDNSKSDLAYASDTPEMYLGENLCGAHPRPVHGLPQELFVITRRAGSAPGDVDYWGRGLTQAEADHCNKVRQHRQACIAAIAAKQPCPEWGV